jgi:hypothetical protein
MGGRQHEHGRKPIAPHPVRSVGIIANCRRRLHEFCGGGGIRGSGLPVPHRRAFATGIPIRAGAAVPASASAYGRQAKPDSKGQSPPLTRCLRRFAILASLANNAGSTARATPSGQPIGLFAGGRARLRGPWMAMSFAVTHRMTATQDASPLPGGGRARLPGPWMAMSFAVTHRMTAMQDASPLPGGGRARLPGPWMARQPCNQYSPESRL